MTVIAHSPRTRLSNYLRRSRRVRLARRLHRRAATPWTRAGATNVDEVAVADSIKALVYLIDRPAQFGPSVSVFWEHEEVLRMDLFDGEPHIHYGYSLLCELQAPGVKVTLPETSRADLAARAAFEVRHNLDFVMRSHPSPRARRSGLDPVALEAASRAVHDLIMALPTTTPTRPGAPPERM